MDNASQGLNPHEDVCRYCKVDPGASHQKNCPAASKKMEPNWHPRLGRLQPTGKLTPRKFELKQGNSTIFVKADAIDEIGAVWDVSHSSFEWEIKCLEWPRNIHAIYTVAENKTLGSATYEIQTYDTQQAIAVLAAERKWLDSSLFVVTNVSAPEDKSNDGVIKPSRRW